MYFQEPFRGVRYGYFPLQSQSSLPIYIRVDTSVRPALDSCSNTYYSQNNNRVDLLMEQYIVVYL